MSAHDLPPHQIQSQVKVIIPPQKNISCKQLMSIISSFKTHSRTCHSLGLTPRIFANCVPHIACAMSTPYGCSKLGAYSQSKAVANTAPPYRSSADLSEQSRIPPLVPEAGTYATSLCHASCQSTCIAPYAWNVTSINIT